MIKAAPFHLYFFHDPRLIRIGIFLYSSKMRIYTLANKNVDVCEKRAFLVHTFPTNFLMHLWRGQYRGRRSTPSPPSRFRIWFWKSNGPNKICFFSAKIKCVIETTQLSRHRLFLRIFYRVFFLLWLLRLLLLLWLLMIIHYRRNVYLQMSLSVSSDVVYQMSHGKILILINKK